MRLLKSSSAFKGLQLALLPTTPQDDEDRLVGIDLDEALLPDGNIKPEYKDWILRFNTLFELSPGDGIRGFCFGHFSTFGGKHKGSIEIYQERKWLTVTGQTIVDSAEDINNAQAAIEEFRAQYFTPYFEVDTSSLPKTNVIFTDEEIVANLEKWPNTERQETFKHYFYKGETTDHSSDDFDLCCMIRYWVQEEEQIDRIFRKSALMRNKWDEMRGSITYGQMTIRNALGCRTADTPIYMEHIIQPLPEKIDFNNFGISLPGLRLTHLASIL
jgi:putative DNA primase/helicase